MIILISRHPFLYLTLDLSLLNLFPAFLLDRLFVHGLILLGPSILCLLSFVNISVLYLLFLHYFNDYRNNIRIFKSQLIL